MLFRTALGLIPTFIPRRECARRITYKAKGILWEVGHCRWSPLLATPTMPGFTPYPQIICLGDSITQGAWVPGGFVQQLAQDVGAEGAVRCMHAGSRLSDAAAVCALL